MDNDRIQEFFDVWSVYDAVLDRNHMFHEPIFRDVASVVASHFAGCPFDVLDLGCGSARHVARALAGQGVGRYTGYDLSPVALDCARGNLSALGCTLDLRCADLADGVGEDAGTHDLIVSSYALHHLGAAEKARFLGSARRRVNEGGLVLVVDVFRDAGEDRATYLDRYVGWIRSEWTDLGKPALDAIEEHIRANDYPENGEEFAAMAIAAGFSRASELNRFGWHRTWRFDP